MPDVIEFNREDEVLELSPNELRRVYFDLLKRNLKKINNNAGEMEQIIQHEKVSLKSKMTEIIRTLLNRTFFTFSEMFSLRNKSRTEVVTGFLAILELSKLNRIKIKQRKHLSEILVYKDDDYVLDADEEKIAADI